jgi:hypothetical protein
MMAGLVTSALVRMRDMGVAERTLPLLEAAVRAVPGRLADDEASHAGPFMSAPEIRHLLNVCTILAAHPHEPGYTAVARLYLECVGAARARVFQREGQWWLKRTVQGSEGETLIGSCASEQAALASSGSYSRAICLSFELARRLLFEGEAPPTRWQLGGLADRGLTRVDALLEKRGIR